MGCFRVVAQSQQPALPHLSLSHPVQVSLPVLGLFDWRAARWAGEIKLSSPLAWRLRDLISDSFTLPALTFSLLSCRLASLAPGLHFFPLSLSPLSFPFTCSLVSVSLFTRVGVVGASWQEVCPAANLTALYSSLLSPVSFREPSTAKSHTPSPFSPPPPTSTPPFLFISIPISLQHTWSEHLRLLLSSQL